MCGRNREYCIGIEMGVEYMKEELIIFGAGKRAPDTYEWAVFAGYVPLFFVDNDPEKWGKMICGIDVNSPGILEKCSGTVVLPDLFRNEIEAQLKEMGYQGRVIDLKHLKKGAVCSGKAQIDLTSKCCHSDIGFVFDAYFLGMNWGGIESYSCMVEGGLKRLGVRTHMLCGMNDKFDRLTENCIHFSSENELLMIKKMAQEITAMLPCVFITHGSIALHAAQLVKSLFPDKIQIVFVTHGDVTGTYEMICFWSDYLDKIICISEKIQRELLEKYGIRKKLLVYRPNPIRISEVIEEVERKENHDGTLRIGFAARLRKEQKRVHLLPQIIEECKKRNLNVEFNIAGEGDGTEELVDNISKHRLEHMVHMLGWIPPVKMAKFWEEQDIYLNISDFEGMSLAMLEAMSCGAVPVVTDVSGVSDVIEDGKNGYVIPVDGWMESVDKFETLERDRELLQKASGYNMELIRKKCDVADYAEWLVRTFHF